MAARASRHADSGTRRPQQADASPADVLEGAIEPLTDAATERIRELPWFASMSADDRSWVGIVARNGIASFLSWYREPRQRPAVISNVFGSAPRELAGVITLQQTVQMVRAAIVAVEEQVDDVVPAPMARDVRDAVVRYSREVAFAAAEIYARAAEQRGAWDARLEALVVDSVLRAETDEVVRSRAAALGWQATSGVCVVVGHAPTSTGTPALDQLQHDARAHGLDALSAVQGDRLVVILGGVDDPRTAAGHIAGSFGDGPVVAGPYVDDLMAATASARSAIAGLRAAAGWPGAPRPTTSDDLLPERALSGDGHARRQLTTDVFAPLEEAGASLLETLSGYLDASGSVEATARALYVHPNTVRYRLRRIADVTGLQATNARDAYTLRVALTLGRLRAL